MSDETINTIMHCRHSILFTNDDTWVKKDNPHFDVAMGSFDGAEICELVGLYMLQHLSAIFGEKNSVGLYRDDGLAILQNISGLEAERIRKKVIEVFKDHGLQLDIDSDSFRRIFLTLPSTSRQKDTGRTISLTTSRCILTLSLTIPLSPQKNNFPPYCPISGYPTCGAIKRNM